MLHDVHMTSQRVSVGRGGVHEAGVPVAPGGPGQGAGGAALWQEPGAITQAEHGGSAPVSVRGQHTLVLVGVGTLLWTLPRLMPTRSVLLLFEWDGGLPGELNRVPLCSRVRRQGRAMELEFGEFQRGTEQLQLQLLGRVPGIGGHILPALDWASAEPTYAAAPWTGREMPSREVGPPNGWSPLLVEADLGEGFTQRAYADSPEPESPASKAHPSSGANSKAAGSLPEWIQEEASHDVPGLPGAGSGRAQSAWQTGSDALGMLSEEVSSFSQGTQALLRQIYAISI